MNRTEYIQISPEEYFWKFIGNYSIDFKKDWYKYPNNVIVKNEIGDVVMVFNQRNGHLYVDSFMWKFLKDEFLFTKRESTELIKKEVKKYLVSGLKKAKPKNIELTFLEKLRMYFNFKTIKLKIGMFNFHELNSSKTRRKCGLNKLNKARELSF